MWALSKEEELQLGIKARHEGQVGVGKVGQKVVEKRMEGRRASCFQIFFLSFILCKGMKVYTMPVVCKVLKSKTNYRVTIHWITEKGEEPNIPRESISTKTFEATLT